MSSPFQQFAGTLPYASETFGIYQPLLGWRAKRAKERVNRERRRFTKVLIESMLRDRRVRDAVTMKHLSVGPDVHLPPKLPAWLRTPSAERIVAAIPDAPKPGGRTDWKAILKNAKLGGLGGGRAPTPSPGAPPPAVPPRGGPVLPGAPDAKPPPTHDALDAAIRDAVVAGTLEYLAVHAPGVLDAVLQSQPADWEAAHDFLDPLAAFDPATQEAVLSPVGLIQLFRETFFELDAFAGPPVGHVWISPGGMVELFEVHTRRTLEEQQIEIVEETTVHAEKAVTVSDELSESVSRDNSRGVNVGVSASGGADIGIAEVSASASFGMTLTHGAGQQAAHQRAREQSERISSEIRRSFKTTFRTSVEVQDTSSRRYVLQNTTDKLVNYELRRKMRRVGVQLQHIGTQLCWQIYLDDPGWALAIAELVHVAKPEDTSSAPPPEGPPVFEPKETPYQCTFPYEPRNDDCDADDDYHMGNSEDGGHIQFTRDYQASPPAAGYEIAGVTELPSNTPTDPEEDPPVFSAGYDWKDKADPTTFTVTLRYVNFNDQPSIQLNLNIIWEPTDATKHAADAAHEKKVSEYTEQKKREAHAQYVAAVRERVEMAGRVRRRASRDLRNEERTVIYRGLIKQLTRSGGDEPRHVTAELIRALFDTERMLYFVAPEWWVPRLRDMLHLRGKPGAPARNPAPAPGMGSPSAEVLTEKDRIGWGGLRAAGRASYLITEESEPAPLGASLGWVIQLDGDDHRNAFLNAPYVKAVLPIRPGRELAAIAWLKRAHVEGSEGLKEPYAGAEPELQGKTLEQALLALAEGVGSMSTSVENMLSSERVFETGFDPLESGFRATGTPYEVFDQWIEILPTDQVVATEYSPHTPPPDMNTETDATTDQGDSQ